MNVDKDGLVHDASTVNIVDGHAYVMVNDLMSTTLTVTVADPDGAASLFDGHLYKLACESEKLRLVASGAGGLVPLYAAHEVRETPMDVDCMACIAEACR